jgi:predicted HTH transcriptional regulator
MILKPGEFNTEEDSSHLPALIRQGEGQTLEFKFEISDVRKIARTLVAFANTTGGNILVGVKDNGAVAGMRSDEEYYMLDAAATMYCKPPVSFIPKLHDLEGKLVLEARIPKSADQLHTAPDKEGRYKVFIRKGAENLLPGGIFIKIHQQRRSGIGVTIAYSDQEQFLLHYLLENPTITLGQFRKKAHIPWYQAEKIMVNFVLLGIIAMDSTDKGDFFRLKDPERSIEIIKKIDQKISP